MSDSASATFPVAAWTWHDGKGSSFSTQIFSDGQIQQERKYGGDDSISPQKLGAISPAEATALLARCREAVNAPPAAQPVPDTEGYELTLSESAGQNASRQVSRAGLNSDAVLSKLRGEILAARKKVARRWNMWHSAGARWLYLTLAVTIGLGIYIASDMKHDDKLQARAQKTTGTVAEQGGTETDTKNQYLLVNLDGVSGSPQVRIYKYLSLANWKAATVGSKVDVLYDAQSKEAWLASDIQRWQSDKKTIWVIPGFLLLAAFIGLAWLRRYEIGRYGDGDEYLIREDRVVSDDKSALIKRSTVLWFKMFI